MSEEDERNYRLIAPDIDSLKRCFSVHHLNPRLSTPALQRVVDMLWDILAPLAPSKRNNEAKLIWFRVPRGNIEDFESFENAKLYDEVETYEEYEDLWHYNYPDEYVWYSLSVVKSYNHKDGALEYFGVSIGDNTVISASVRERGFDENDYYPEDIAVKLCELIAPAVRESIRLLKSGEYNALVEKELPYQFRTGVVKRKVLWESNEEQMKFDLDGLGSDEVDRFKAVIESGANDINKIGRITDFTANAFYNACKLGYEAIGKDCKCYALPELYQKYSDGRDDGLTGLAHGLEKGEGIDPEDPKAWDEWYDNSFRCGGHPWEVVPGGNSTHMSLFVRHDGRELGYKLRAGEITQEEYDEKMKSAGYYFEITGMQRQFESVRFYLALTDAGLPVIIDGAEEFLSRFEASDYVGIVPHAYPTRYCESLFPKKYGKIISFCHAYKDEDVWFDKIEWLFLDKAELIESE